jgi:hypothetical protein
MAIVLYAEQNKVMLDIYDQEHTQRRLDALSETKMQYTYP